MYIDFDTPSGDASLLRDHPDGAAGSDSSVLNSTEISSLNDNSTRRPEPNLSAISAQPPTQPSLTTTGASTDPSFSSQSGIAGPAGIPCDLCGQYVRSQAYLTQHLNKMKCQEKQRTRSSLRHPLLGWSHSECLRVTLVLAILQRYANHILALATLFY